MAYTKDPEEELDYAVDWTAQLPGGDTLATSTWVAGGGLVITSDSHTDTRAVAWVAGGDLGTVATLTNRVTTTQGRTLEHTLAITVAESLDAPAQQAYADISLARRFGAVGADPLVQAAIEQASRAVERFTGEWFTPRIATVVARVGADGRAILPHRVTSTDGPWTVVDHDSGVEYVAAAYRVMSSALDGEVDAIGVGRGWAGANMLVLGLEPWAPGRVGAGVRLRVTGLMGWPVPPVEVATATAMLAAHITKQWRPDDDNDPSTPTPPQAGDVDEEGNVIPVVPGGQDEAQELAEDVASGRRTTGLRAADALLLPYRRDPGFTVV